MIQVIHIPQDRSTINPNLTNTLITEIENTLREGEKILLYLNRRGTHSSYICDDCGWSPMCPNCDIYLKVYDTQHTLECHTCGHDEPLTNKCPKCKGSNLKKIGVGTQQVELSIKKLFPNHIVYRFDGDTTKKVADKKSAMQDINNADIIIGTKMLTTGFNLKKVGLIAVILLEQELSFPKFNTSEQVYTTLRQLIGRGNRKSQKTNILLQTYNPESDIVRSLTSGNYKDFLITMLQERKEFKYPPFYEMMEIEYRSAHKDKSENYISEISKIIQDFIDENKHHNDTVILSSYSAFKKKGYFYTSVTIKGKNLGDIHHLISPGILKTPGATLRFY